MRLEITDRLQLSGGGGGERDLVSLIARVRNSGVREKKKKFSVHVSPTGIVVS